MSIEDGWAQAPFNLAAPNGPPREVVGYRKGLIGFYMAGRYLGVPLYSIIHLRTGAEIVTLPVPKGHAAAIELADEIADAGDWDFGDLTGWQNMDPGLPAKVATICAKRGVELGIVPPEATAEERAATVAAGRLNGA